MTGDRNAADRLDAIFLSVFAVVAVWSWAGFTLAEFRIFRSATLLAIAIPGSIVVLWLMRRAVPATNASPRRRAGWWAALWLAAATILFARPGEYAIDGGDASVYLNIGAGIVRHGGLPFPEPVLALINRVDRPEVLRPVRRSEADLDFFPGGMQVPAGTDTVQPNFFHLFPVWVAILDLIGGPNAGYYAAGLFAFLSVFAVWLLGRRLDSLTAANIAAALLCVNFTQVWFARISTSETLAQFLILAGLTFTVCAARWSSRAHGLAAGVAFGLAACTRLDALLLVSPVVGVFLAIVAIRRRWSPAWSAMTVAFALFTAHAVLHAFLVTPMYTNRALFLAFASSTVNYAALALPPAVLAAGVLVWFLRSHRTIRVSPAIVRAAAVAGALLVSFRLAPQITNNGYLALLLTPAGLVLAIAGAVWLVRDTDDEAGVGLLVAGVFLASLLIYAESPRDRQDLPLLLRRFVPVVLPLALVLAAIAIARTAAKVGRWRAAVFVAPAILAAVFEWQTRPILATAPMQGIHAQIRAVSDAIPPGSLVLVDETTQSHFAMTLRYQFGHDVLFVYPGMRAADVLNTIVGEANRLGRQVVLAVGRDGMGVNALDARNLTRMNALPMGGVALDLTEIKPSKDRLPREMVHLTPVVELYSLQGTGPLGLPFTVDIGDHDAGWRQEGFYGFEAIAGATARWTAGRATVVLPQIDAAANPATISLRLSCPRPSGIGPPQVRVDLDGEVLGLTPPAGGAFDVVTMALPTWAVDRLHASRTRLTLQVPVFVPSEVGVSADVRALGVVVDWIKIDERRTIVDRAITPWRAIEGHGQHTLRGWRLSKEQSP